jgi:branched-chain amino acid transport system permease protein
VGEIVQTLVINWDWVGGARGLFVPIKRPDSFRNFQFHDSKQTYYYIALGLLLLALWLTHRMERSRTGYYFRAIREDQDAAASLGIPVTRYKLRAMALSAALTALGGTFYAQYISEVITAINRDRGLTVVFIEQNVEIALKLAHRGYVRESGRNILEGPAAELLRCPEVRRIFLGA